MPTLTVYRGLPASGKTTAAYTAVAENPEGRVRVGRDGYRDLLHGARLYKPATERAVTVAQHATIASLLAAGLDVHVDDMNLRSRYVRDLRQLAVAAGAEFEIVDMTDVPLEECIRRDKLRNGQAHVGEEFIRDQWTRFIRGKGHPLPTPDEPADAALPVRPYVPPADGMPAVLVDLDGTVALMDGRDFTQEHLVGTDLPNVPVLTAVRALDDQGYNVIFMSGRTDACRADTETWLREHFGREYEALHMRKAGDFRKDAIVKVELFDANVRDRYDVLAVWDDRAQVVAAWRALGLTVFQVAEGNF